MIFLHCDRLETLQTTANTALFINTEIFRARVDEKSYQTQEIHRGYIKVASSWRLETTDGDALDLSEFGASYWPRGELNSVTGLVARE